MEDAENIAGIAECSALNTSNTTTKRETDDTDDDPLALPITSMTNTTCISESTTTTNTSNSNMNLSMMASSFSQEIAEKSEIITNLKLSSRKQKRKEKHREKRPEGNNDIDGNEKSANREHKRKRKKKQYEMASLDVPTNDSIPKIKIKFKTLPLPGEVTPEAHFFYVPANMVRSEEDVSRPTSVETVEEASSTATNTLMPIKTDCFPENSGEPNNILIETSLGNKRINNTKTPSRKSRSRKVTSKQRQASVARPPKSSAYHATQSLICCICQASGTSSNAVTCDECRRHYHFTCLEPPLKKSPKIRGYSWHCADCDPTDVEKI